MSCLHAGSRLIPRVILICLIALVGAQLSVGLAAASGGASAANFGFTVQDGSSLQVPAPGLLAGAMGTGTITVTGNSAVSDGTLSVSQDGSFAYTPTVPFSGDDSFTFTVTDSQGNTATGTVNIGVEPVVLDQAFTTRAGRDLSVGAPGLLSGAIGTSVTASLLTGPSHGTVSVQPGGSFTYDPSVGFSGTDSFTFEGVGGGQLSPGATVTVTVTPSAVQDSFVVVDGRTLNVAAPGVLANDLGSGLSVTGHTSPSHGTLTQNADGSLSYTPDIPFSGGDAYTYTVTDSSGQMASSTVALEVGLVVQNQTYSAAAGTALTVGAPGVLTGALGSSLSASLVSGPSHGEVLVQPDGSFTYSPATGFSGIDQFHFRASDSSGSSDAVATISVVPTVTDQAYSTNSGVSLSVAAPGVLSGSVGISLSASTVTPPTHGSVNLSSDGSFTYRPDPGFAGIDHFSFQASDLGGTSAPATVTITVGAIVQNQSFTVAQGNALSVRAPGVLVGATGTGLSASVVTQPTHAHLVLDPAGSFTYSPDPAFSGTDDFTFEASNGNATSNTATVTISVVPRPVALDGDYSVVDGSVLHVAAPGIFANDSGSGITLTSHSAPVHGSLTQNPDGSFSYTPDVPYSGPDSYTYTLTDSIGQTATASIDITVRPTAADQSYATSANTILRVVTPGLLTGALGSTLTVSIVSGPSHGTLTSHGDGSFSYIPDGGFSGSDSFAFEASDGTGVSAPAAATITVSRPSQPPTPPAPPVAFGGTVVLPSAADGSGGSFALATPSGDGPFHYILDRQVGVGTVAVDPDTGVFTFAGPAGFTGVESYSYRVTDGSGLSSAPALVTVIVQPPPAYRLVGADGGVFDFGSAPYEHSCLDITASCGPITGGAPYADGLGYWLVGADGGVFSFGDAPFFGSLPSLGQRVDDVVAMAASGDGGGYWLVGADGSVYAFGDAHYAGSLPALGVAVGDVVGLASTADGAGYWLAGADGGVFAFGDAPYLGNATQLHLERSVVGIATGPAGGYWLAAADGGVFSFAPPFLGSNPAIGFWPAGTLGVPKVLNGPVVTMIPGS